ncbi:GntR family transcriptional regulator [Kitasatospora sp. NPDC048296]|uniref:GntR family transcriptional regulator n=1 Tax=Kitasatospora sp. NPDC048296 TaxID=3364048 RepID=UPI0037119574
MAQILRDRIIEGQLTPGTRLSEEALGEVLAVSRNTLREAFQRLADERLVVREMNREVFVRVLTPADVYTMRLALETAGVRATPPAAPGQLAVVREALAEADAAEQRGDWLGVGTADLHFHQALAALAGSGRIDDAMRRLLAELRLAWGATPSAHHLHEPFLHRNRKLLSLLEHGEIARLEDELTCYLHDARDLIVDAMREVGQ